MKKYFLLLLLFFTMTSSMLCRADTFVVRHIQIEGLQRISPDTVYSYLPIRKGDILHTEESATLIRTLYNTGFFEHISLDRQGDTLVIHVVERFTIGQLKISGNNVIPTDKLTAVMKSVDVAEGRVFNRAMLDRIRQSLLNQYYQLGRYNARVDISVTSMTRNRVLVKITISEGLIAVIRHINIIGNHAFSERTLRKQLLLSESNLFTLVTQANHYSQEKLNDSLEQLHDFYLDRGYVRFAIRFSQVEITPDRKSIYITIGIKEGTPYTVKGVALKGNLILPQHELMHLITIEPGTIFSRKEVVASEKAISDALGNKGYVFSNISIDPEIDDVHKQVYLICNIKPGKRVYVRHINFIDNAKTNDVALRRDLVQMEAAVISTTRLEQSKHKLSLEPYLRDVEVSFAKVPNRDDQVDVNYKVTEQTAAEASVGVTYSQLYKWGVNAGFNQKNFLGTGKTLGINLMRNKAEQEYSFSYTNPYYTLDGISRTINMSASKFNPAAANNSRSYTSNEYNASMVYGIPLGLSQDVFNTLQLGYGYQSTLINLTNSPTPQIVDFVNRHGRHFQQLNLISGLTRDSRDKAVFPTSGMVHGLGFNLFLPISRSLSYYLATYNVKYYQPLGWNFIGAFRGEFGYGGSFTKAIDYPFYKNFFAGGPDSVRGFEGNTLGPRDINGYSMGGNTVAVASAGLIFPNPISENLRTTVFMDAGNAYNTYDNRIYNGSGSGPIRYSVGLEFDYLVPSLGPIDMSIAKPLKLKRAQDRNFSDEQEIFQFSLGANFG